MAARCAADAAALAAVAAAFLAFLCGRSVSSRSTHSRCCGDWCCGFVWNLSQRRHHSLRIAAVLSLHRGHWQLTHRFRARPWTLPHGFSIPPVCCTRLQVDATKEPPLDGKEKLTSDEARSRGRLRPVSAWRYRKLPNGSQSNFDVRSTHQCWEYRPDREPRDCA
jgi:hypothetical protein